MFSKVGKRVKKGTGLNAHLYILQSTIFKEEIQCDDSIYGPFV